MMPHLAEFSQLNFRYPFRRYQRMALETIDTQAGADRKYHIVAPPGAGKTIVGLELIRRFGRPAVVFCPTTTIQQQWQEKIGLFTDDPAWIGEHTSLDARRLAGINVLTYQVLSTPGENLEFVERIAVERWVDDLLSSTRSQTEAEARRRVATLREANPKAYRREISKRYRRIKRELLRAGSLDGRQFLHPNARALIDRIAALGTGTVVLDECHHLLDYWAFILRELIQTLPDVRVVGLTATLPDPSNPAEYENYTSLLGDVDFEVPTPAVVKEGNLAPYRDLVYFCRPSAREQDYLDGIQKHFESVVWQATHATAFQDWLWQMLFPNPDPARLVAGFESTFRREPLLCIAAVRYLLELGVPIPLDVPIIEEMLEPLSIDDWLVLMENYALKALKVSADPQHQALYRDLRNALLPFGITISERGIRHGRSPGDLVLALSESKDRAVVDILRAEAEAMEHRLRAVVLTDYERMSARTRRLDGILDPDSGSAVRVFRRLVADPVTDLLAPVLVTGKVVLAGARSRPLLEGGIRRWAEARGSDFAWQWRETESEDVLRLVGSGAGWSPRTYVALLTSLFEQGITQCLVGTRGIFGEGWDALRLNTLVDLTSVTTSTGVRQIRGRTIRLDPTWKRKVAHNWDVVCVSLDFDKGNADLRRFITRHDHTWGLVIHPRPAGAGQAMQQAATAARAPQQARSQHPEVEPAPSQFDLQGRIVRGVAHVDLPLAVELATREFQQVRYQAHTRRMLDAVWDRDRVYELWDVGERYENRIYSITRIEAQDLTFRTAHTIRDSLGAITRRLLVSLAAVGGVVWLNGAVVLPWIGIESLFGLGVGVAALSGTAALATVGLNARAIGQVFHRTFLELPADAILLDMGRALLAALRDAGAVSAGLEDEWVRIVETEGGDYEVFLAAEEAHLTDAVHPADGIEPQDLDTFSRAYRQMLGPLGDARYLIERDSSSLRNLVYRPLWAAVRAALGQNQDLKAYHRVPDVLASRRERAEALARHWQEYVGGGRLVYTRTAEGRRILLEARAQRRSPIHQMAFEIWQ